ncbi:MAG: hypothetical protein ACE5KM_08950 [Planctomycetaceae bacterium]
MAVPLWRQLLKEHPDSLEADRSTDCVGVVCQQTKRWKEAEAAYESLLKDRPESAFAKLTKEQLKQVERGLSRADRRVAYARQCRPCRPYRYLCGRGYLLLSGSSLM